MKAYFRNRPLTYYGKTPKKIGDGTYSCVYKYKARKRKGVAVKVHNDATAFFREITLLDECKTCPYIVDMLDVGYDFKRSKLYHVMPLADTDLYHQIQFEFFREHPEKVKTCTFQILQALALIHVKQYLHRDIKAENILVFQDESGDITYKLCDFGLSRKSHQSGACYTSYMVTLYYRPPENLLGRSDYTYSIDVWSMGCILAELILGETPFAINDNSEAIAKQLQSLGSFLDLETAPEYLRDAIQDIPPEELEEGREWWNENIRDKILDSEHSAAYDLIEKMLTLDPSKRISVREALLHPYFEEYRPISFPLLPIFKMSNLRDWSNTQAISWDQSRFNLIKLQNFLDGIEYCEMVFVKTVFLFNAFANIDDAQHLTPENMWSYMIIIARIVSKLCCGDPIELSKINKYMTKKRSNERTRYFLNKMNFDIGVYTGYDWLLEPKNVYYGQHQIPNDLDIEELCIEARKLYISSIFVKEISWGYEPKVVAEACHTYVLKKRDPEIEIPEVHGNIHRFLRGDLESV